MTSEWQSIANDIYNSKLDYVEIIPFGDEHVIAENVMGIPKKVLVKSFVECRKMSTWESTLIVLLAIHEPLTHINMRKRMILDSPCKGELELNVLDMLACSPLPKHNKSPMLWQHRRWLLSEASAAVDVDRELRTVFHSAHRHDKNYYAWDHLRWLLVFAGERVDRGVLAARVFDYIGTHVSDISAWSFLFDLGHDLAGYRMRALELVSLYAGHEAIWWFITWTSKRTGLAIPRVLEPARSRVEECLDYELRQRAIRSSER